MKCLNKIMVFFLFMLFSYGLDISAYTYTVTNLTGRDVKVQLNWLNGKLNEEAELIRPYGTKIFSFKGLNCLYKIIVSSFDEEEGKWITLLAPFRATDSKQFSKTQNAALEFNKLLKNVGEKLAIVYLEEMDISQEGLVGIVEASRVLSARNFCKDRDFILVLNYDPIIRFKRVFALTK